MINFFGFSSTARILISFMFGICVLIQTLNFILNLYCRIPRKTRVFDNLLELFILCEIIIFSLLHGQVVSGYNSGFVAPSGYEIIRVAIFFSLIVLVVVVCVFNKTLLPLSVIPAAAITLPVFETLLGSTFPWVFIAALVFFLARSIKSFMSNIILLKTNISALSVKNAIDTLHTGVLFSENDGYILLLNYQMQNLMLAFTGKVFRNAIHFYDTLLSDTYDLRYEKSKLEDQVVYLLPDGSAWILTKTIVPYKMKNYIHISLSDVSELWALTTKLQHQYEELTLKSLELKETIANLHTITKEKEIEKAKIRAHDILGQRMTVLLRTIQNEHNLDYELLSKLSKGLLDELKSEDSIIKPYDELKNIQHVFSSIGVDINFNGQLPNDLKQANLYINIVREASTNAVRHGLATKINIKSELTDSLYKLIITNNGHTTSTPLIPGSGITLMKKRTLEQGGEFHIIQSPEFSLSVILPGGEQYV